MDLLQKEPGPFKSPPMSPPDGKSFEVKSLIFSEMENGMKPLFNMGFGENFGKNLKFDYFFGKFRNKMSHNK